MTVLAAPCPYCGRPTGAPCYDYRTHGVCEPHASRIAAVGKVSV